jgi:hypothetical protein
LVILTKRFDSVTGRLLLLIWSAVITIQILVEVVHATVSSRYPIRVEHRYEDKDEVFSEKMCSHVFFVE